MTDNLSWFRRMHGSRHVASCMQVGKDLQSYLDGHVDDLTAGRVARHLELCRRCGMQAETYTQIKASLARRGTPIDPGAVSRLRTFGEQLVAEGSEPGSDLFDQA